MYHRALYIHLKRWIYVGLSKSLVFCQVLCLNCFKSSPVYHVAFVSRWNCALVTITVQVSQKVTFLLLLGREHETSFIGHFDIIISRRLLMEDKGRSANSKLWGKPPLELKELMRASPNNSFWGCYGSSGFSPIACGKRRSKIKKKPADLGCEALGFYASYAPVSVLPRGHF